MVGWLKPALVFMKGNWKWMIAGLLVISLITSHGYAYQKGRLAEARDRTKLAEQLADKAIALEKRESAIALREAEIDTRKIEQSRAEGRELKKELEEATNENPSPDTISDDQLRILQDIARKTYED